MPFEGTEVEGYKLALQGTFGVAFDRHFIQGTQFIAERDAHADRWELSFLYVPGLRFDPSGARW